MNATLLSWRRMSVMLAAFAMLLVFAVTPVAAGGCDDDEEDCDTGGGGGSVPNTAMTVPGPDYSALLTILGGTALVSAAGLRFVMREQLDS